MDVDAILHRSTRTAEPIISSDCVVYIQEADCDIGVKNDLQSFQAMSGINLCSL